MCGQVSTIINLQGPRSPIGEKTFHVSVPVESVERRDESTAGVSFADGVLEVRGQTLLRDVTERPRGERRGHQVFRLVNRENTSAAVEPASRRDAATSSPFMPGMETSSTITSGSNVAAASIPARPFMAVPTIVQDVFSTAAARMNIASLSSTSRIRGSALDSLRLIGGIRWRVWQWRWRG